MLIFILSCLVQHTLGLPINTVPAQHKQTSNEDEPESGKPNDIFTKILLSNKGVPRALTDGDIAVKFGRSASRCFSCRWDKNDKGQVIVPYIISSKYNDSQVSLITATMHELEAVTCVLFVPRATEKDAINITSGNGCWSYYGRIGGIQELSLSANGCIYKGVIQHELNHVLGFPHEHNRSDRDKYVDILTENILPGALGNFDIYNSFNMELPYDYASVMHYPRDAFSISHGLDTIVPKPDPNIAIGQRYGPTNLDIVKINTLYQCDVCSTILSNSSGTFVTMYNASEYPKNSNCVWFIRVPLYQVSLKINTFNTEYSATCTSNFIQVYDGATKTSPILWKKSCGMMHIPPLIATSNLMLIHFVTDWKMPKTGFHASYKTIQCGGTFYNPSRNFTSPGYPNEYYPNMNCSWTITAPPRYKISLNISGFYLEYSHSCSLDNLTIYDGDNIFSPALFYSCGEVKVPIQTSSGNTMLLLLRTSLSVQKRGFKASYTTTLI